MNVKYVDESNNSETVINTSQLANGKYSFIKESDYPVNFEENSSMNYFIIEINSPGNSLVSVGSNLNLFQNNNQINQYTPNSKEIYGILNNNSPKQCFDFGIKSTQKLNYYLSVLDFQKNINIEITNKSGDKISTQEITNGMILVTITSDNAENYYCLTKKNNDNIEASFALQVTYDVENNYQKNIYSPQINGFFYERYLEAGQLAFYTGLSSLKFKTELRYILKKISGNPLMYFAKCETFPHCEFDINHLPSDSTNPTKTNDIFSYSIYKTEMTNAISPEQYVLLVLCMDESCSFETNFYSELDNFILPKEKKIYQTIMDEGLTNFVIKLDGENNYKQIFVDFYTYSGDISIKYEAEGFTVREYFAGNKKYFVLDKNTNNKNEVYFYVTGEMDSYYSVDYKLISADTDKIIMLEESGINYLETIEPKFGYKTVSLVNSRLRDERNFLVNFYSLNCEISVTRKLNGQEKKLENIDYLAQDIILNSDDGYNSEKYDYYMEIVKMDNVTKFDTNWCMVHVSSIENNLNIESNYQKRQLLTSEGVINRIILNKSFPKIEYIYPHINPSGYVLINLNMGTNSKVNVKITIDNKEYKEITTGKSQYFIIEESKLRSNQYCPILVTRPNQICNIIVEITLDSQFYDEEPLIELTIKSKEEIPSFISKSKLRRDVITGNYHQYFFTEVGKNEQGNVNVNFDYGGGNVYGRIIKKNENEGSGWMNRYILPNENNNMLKYDYYTKKIYYDIENTQDCEYGCYLFLKVEPYFFDEYYKYENIAYPISLSIESIDGSLDTITQNLLNSIDIPINEYIIGDTIPFSDRFNNFYTFWIPFDSEELIFEFIGDSTYISINIGNAKPTLDKSDFILNEIGQDDILRITKTQILEKIGTTVSNIKNIQLTIAIGAKYKDNENSSLFSFRIRALRKNEIELIPLTNDHKTLCDIKGKNGNCYFILPYHRKVDEQNNFFFHALDMPNVDYNYYAYEVDKDIITNRNNDKINEIISNKQNAKWSNENSKGNYLYIDNSQISDKENGVYILLNIEINAPKKEENEKTTINLLHTVYSYKGIILPNPSNTQLYIANNNNLNELILNFSPHNENLIVHIKSIYGKGKVFWDLSDDIILNKNKFQETNSEDENTYYYLSSPGDTVSLTIGNSEILPFHAINTNPNTYAIDTNNEPGFGFYIYFEKESQNQNYHNIFYGQSSLFSFKNTDFPYIFYSRLPDKTHEIDINIKINSLKYKAFYLENYLKNEEMEENIPSYDEFEINGLVINETIIYNKKSNSDYIPENKNEIKGIYDPVNKLFKIQYNKETFNKYDINNNYLYITISKGQNNKKIYTEATMECSILPSDNDGYYPEMNKYINGKIPYEQDGYSRYELTRINSLYEFMRIEFAANFDKVNFALNSHRLNDDINKIDFYKNNTDFISHDYYNGKSVIVVNFPSDDIKSVYLSVFTTQNSHKNLEQKLSNFIFKYEVKEKNDFINLIPETDEVSSFNYNRGAINITLPRIIGVTTQSKINYIAKLISTDDAVKDENMYTISPLESTPIKVYTKTQQDLGSDEKLELIDIHNDKIYYLVINCEVFDKENKEEKFGFKYIYNPTDYKEEKAKVSLAVVLVVIILMVVLAIGFVLVFLYLKNTNLRKSIQLQELNQKLNKSNVLGNEPE